MSDATKTTRRAWAEAKIARANPLDNAMIDDHAILIELFICIVDCLCHMSENYLLESLLMRWQCPSSETG